MSNARRRQKWAQHREQGFGPGLQLPEVSEDVPQPPLVAPPAEPIGDVSGWDEAELDAPPVVSAAQCPKCGRQLKARGQHLHVNRCKGAA